MNPAISRAGAWSTRLWQEIKPTYAAILAHPFLTGLTDGTLDRGAFGYYVTQDVHYLRDYARALAVVGAKAPTHTDTAMFARHAAGAVEVELALHATLLLGLAAVLPCYWIYAQVGQDLLERGSPDPHYQRWIDTYAGEEFAEIVAEVLALVDRTGSVLGSAEEAQARAHFATTARYEWCSSTPHTGARIGHCERADRSDRSDRSE